MGDHDKEREATLQEIARKKVLYELPGMDAVRVRRDIGYRTTAASGLLMDIYYPAATTPANGIPSSPSRWPIPIHRPHPSLRPRNVMGSADRRIRHRGGRVRHKRACR
jgi:hypothetical protein